MRSRFLGGVSFLPLYAPEGEGGQAEMALESQKDDFAASLEAEADKKPEDQNDPNDLNHSEADEQAEAKQEEPTVKAEQAEEEAVKDEDEEVQQLRKTVKALGKRVSTLSREKRDLHTKLQENIKSVKAEEAEAEPEQPQREDFKTKAEWQEAVRAEAARQRAAEEFNRQCNETEAAGVKAFGADKWAKAKQDLSMLDDMGRIPLDLLSVALETDNPAQVLFKLGNDVDLATEMMGMTPIKRAIAMDKLAATKPVVARQQSKTPPPVDPIGAKGASDDRPRDSDSDEEWNRKEEIRERKVREEKRRRLGLA